MSPAAEALAIGTCAIFVVALVVAETRGSLRGKWATKPAASAAFLALALLRLDSFELAHLAILAALSFSAAGDLLLIPEDSLRTFRAGIVVFLFAHLAFIAAFLAHGVDPLATAGATAVLAIVGVLVGRAIVKRAGPGLERTVAAYLVVISAMVAMAAGAASRGSPLWLLAAVAFYLSDLTVARHRFLQREAVNRQVGLPLYYAAQLLFAWSLSVA